MLVAEWSSRIHSKCLSLIGYFKYTPELVTNWSLWVLSSVTFRWLDTLDISSYFRCFGVSGHFEYVFLLQYRILWFFSLWQKFEGHCSIKRHSLAFFSKCDLTLQQPQADLIYHFSFQITTSLNWKHKTRITWFTFASFEFQHIARLSKQSKRQWHRAPKTTCHW